jgi:pyrroline-5-carboxylate reductase
MKRITKTIGFIGCGNMGGAILAGIVSSNIVSRRSVFIFDNDKEKLGRLKKRYGVVAARSNDEVIDRADIIVVAVKPQMLNDLGISLKNNKDKVIVSILAGTTIKKLENAFKTARIVRTMPNLGATLGIGITAIAETKIINKKMMGEIVAIFTACGAVVRVPEKLMNAVTAISGSGPAYYFYLSELLIDAACKNGLSHEAAVTLVLKTAAAASAMMLVTKTAPSTLRAMVTSKKGTTDAALKTFKKMNFAKAVGSGVKAAIKRGEELSR